MRPGKTRPLLGNGNHVEIECYSSKMKITAIKRNKPSTVNIVCIININLK